MKTLLLILTYLFCLNLQAKETHVAVAANFMQTMQALIPLFKAQTGYHVKVSYGSTGKLFAQIHHGAPFDVFLAADSQRPKQIESLGLSVTDSRFTYATGKLVLWSKQNQLFTDGLAHLKEAFYDRLSIGNPKTVPYGQAAKELLQNLGIWEKNQHKLLRGENISQAFQFITSGNAPLGLVALSQIRQLQEKTGSLWVVPSTYHTPIHQQAILLKNAVNNPAAHAFITFLKSPAVQKIIHLQGYESTSTQTAAR